MPVEPVLPPLILTDAEHVPDPDIFTGDAAPDEAEVAYDLPEPATEIPPTPVVADVTAPSSPRVLAPRGPALLQLASVCTDIGRYHILHGVDLEVPTGGVTMLLGRNGAGKTTTLRTIMGLWRARAGRVALGGQDITRWRPHRIARAGIGFVPEDMGIFGDLTVAENMMLAARSTRLSRDRLDWIFRAFPALETFWRARAGDLSGGQKQMLSVARVMAEKRRLYLIDEPTKGLAPAIVDTLAGALQDLKRQGGSILMVEQNFAVATELGDTAAVMEDGRIVWAGEMAELAEDRALQARYLGLNVEAA
ncbi:MAG: ABC transporter ATP-binding protein [Rhodobacteraceae bacterium]|nr:ABC transporter ATP-binding protein [Paracoccaceae bacterium]